MGRRKGSWGLGGIHLRPHSLPLHTQPGASNLREFLVLSEHLHIYELCGCPLDLLECSQPQVSIPVPYQPLSSGTQSHLLHQSQRSWRPTDVHFFKSPPLYIKICFMSLSSTPAHENKVLSSNSLSYSQGVGAFP